MFEQIYEKNTALLCGILFDDIKLMKVGGDFNEEF
ncbi:unknown [[Mannheimia] succiniciproducens MBEL55E]|uniref:Uncharacterized protein n=1 Tax=Mannheimia succiniciproducens (strain KCTC 0769BP / MBEL55E) TaxID=221988 RepID=Q65WM4_MANSM|nr:unknown [[Mannheimia] succiniciproducens MBEL55E]